MSFLTVGITTSWSAQDCCNIPADEFIRELGLQCSNPSNLLGRLILFIYCMFFYLLSCSSTSQFFLSILTLCTSLILPGEGDRHVLMGGSTTKGGIHGIAVCSLSKDNCHGQNHRTENVAWSPLKYEHSLEQLMMSIQVILVRI